MVLGTFRQEVGLSTHTQFVRSELRRLGVALADIDDLMQEVWLMGLARSRSFSDEATAQAWLGKVCKRVATVELRSRGKTPLLPKGVDPELAVDPDQDARVEEDFDERKCVAALECLTAKQLDVLALYGSGELAMREVAELVGEPEKTVYSRYRSAIDDVTRELRRSDSVGIRTSHVLSRHVPAAARKVSLAEEHAADLGECLVLYADSKLAIGRLGNAIIAHWRERPYEWCADEVGAALHAAHARAQMPLVLLNIGTTDLPLPNAKERAALIRNIRATRLMVGTMVDVLDNEHTARLLRSILNGIFLLTRSYVHHSFALVGSLDDARSLAEPHLRTVRGSLRWEKLVRAVQLVRGATLNSRA